ncbi:MAG: A/G-specific adenine glycosylase [Desulfovibrionaceae bacterium]|nr:A/G-specific adenine glycosylase [Desulfovibrionaceae bacterium]
MAWASLDDPLHDPVSDPVRLHSVRTALLDWFSANARDLPWRRDYSPYSVWIAESMLQQTQMQRGVAFYCRWMERFPNLASVAFASEESILRAWEGLGYYSRARNVHATAKILLENFGGEFPRDLMELEKLPGIGRYTARAICGIAFEETVACVDANVLRIVSRIFDVPYAVDSAKGRRLIETIATSLILKGQARATNQAMMEFGALVCGKDPLCSMCPLATLCLACARGTVLVRPVKKRTVRRETKTVACALFVFDKSLLVERRTGKRIWSGLLTLPEVDVPYGSTPKASLLSHLSAVLGVPLELGRFERSLRHAYTKWTITLWGIALTSPSLPSNLGPYTFLSLSDLYAAPLPSPHRKLIHAYQEAGADCVR